MRDLRIAAYHEAGQAVASRWYKHRFGQVSIDPDDKTLGSLMWFSPAAVDTPRERLKAEAFPVICFAGQAATQRFLGRRPPRYSYKSDNVNTVRVMSYFFRSWDARKSFLELCFFESRDLIKWQWCAIEAVAQALLERKRLTEAEVIEVMERASPGNDASATGKSAGG